MNSNMLQPCLSSIKLHISVFEGRSLSCFALWTRRGEKRNASFALVSRPGPLPACAIGEDESSTRGATHLWRNLRGQVLRQLAGQALAWDVHQAAHLYSMNTRK